MLCLSSDQKDPHTWKLIDRKAKDFFYCISFGSRQQTACPRRIAGDTLNLAFRNHLPAMSVISSLESLKQLSQLMHPGKVNLRLGPSVACKPTYTISTLQRFLRLGPAEAQS
jgi:hypothetical protein